MMNLLELVQEEQRGACRKGSRSPHRTPSDGHAAESSRTTGTRNLKATWTLSISALVLHLGIIIIVVEIYLNLPHRSGEVNELV